ncbi:transposase, Mutator family protein [Arthrobacter sp. PAMC 25486]|nr:transposase, Mutator family protein [Arthrobacter sp. PAMC 25486]
MITVVTDCNLAGVSPRRRDKLVETQGIDSLLKSQVSGMAADLDERVVACRARPLTGPPLTRAGPFAFVAAEALRLRVREDLRISNTVAVGAPV